MADLKRCWLLPPSRGLVGLIWNRSLTYLMPQILLRQLVPAEAIARNPPRFTTLTGKRSPCSGTESDGSKIHFTLGQSSQFA